MKATWMSIDRWKDKEVVVPMHNGILLSHKKEHIWVISNEVDEPRAYYTEWIKSERQILYTNTYIWNLERWYWRIYLQSSNGETDTENRLMDTGRREERVRWMDRVTWKLNMWNSQWEFPVCLRELKQGLCIKLGGGMGKEIGGSFKREGTYVDLWLIHVEVWQKTTKSYKAIILQ